MTYTQYDSKMKSNDKLKDVPVQIKYGTISMKDGKPRKTRLSLLNRIFAPIMSVETLEDLREALHEVEENAGKLDIFSEMEIGIESHENPQVENGQIITLSPKLKEREVFQADWDILNAASVKQFASNSLGIAERIGFEQTYHPNRNWKIASICTVPLSGQWGIDSMKFEPFFYEKSFGESVKGSLIEANLVGGHKVAYEYGLRSQSSPLSMISYTYQQDRVLRHNTTLLPISGQNYKFECDLNGITKLNDFVRAKFTYNLYYTFKQHLLTSFHFRLGGVQSEPDNSSISKNDLIRNSIRGQQLPNVGNFSLEMMTRLMFPLLFLGTFFELTKVHGQGFFHAGNAMDLNFGGDDFQQFQSKFVSKAHYSIGGGLYFPLNKNNRIEVNTQFNLGEGEGKRFQILWSAGDLL